MVKVLLVAVAGALTMSFCLLDHTLTVVVEMGASGALYDVRWWMEERVDGGMGVLCLSEEELERRFPLEKGCPWDSSEGAFAKESNLQDSLPKPHALLLLFSFGPSTPSP